MSDEERYRERASEVMVQIGRQLRRRPTEAEELLWEYLRKNRLNGIKFRRQHPISETNYIIDFYCYESHLVIELDGGIHDTPDQRILDIARQQAIEALGHHVLRLRNDLVFTDLSSVMTEILKTHTCLVENKTALPDNYS